MSITEILSFIISWIPYVNTGLIVLIIGFVFEKFGFRTTRGEFKRRPWQSLYRGLCLVFLSSLFSIIIHAQMSGFEPLMIFIILIAAYWIFTQV